MLVALARSSIQYGVVLNETNKTNSDSLSSEVKRSEVEARSEVTLQYFKKILVMFNLILSLFALVSVSAGQASEHQICSALVNRSLCTSEDTTTASWCSDRNPYLFPRFLSTADADALSSLSELASPVCEDDYCYMFSKFFATTFLGRPLFIANVVTEDADTNSIVAIDGLTFKVLPNLSPRSRNGSSFTGVSVTDSISNSLNYIGATQTVVSRKYYRGSYCPGSVRCTQDIIDTTFARRMTGIYVNEQSSKVKGTWDRDGFIDLFSDFVSVSTASAGSLVDTQQSGWWIYPGGHATFVSLTKHRTFDLYRLYFSPGNSDEYEKEAQIFEIDREPSDMKWAKANCLETDPSKLYQILNNSPSCKNSFYPNTSFLKTCPADCAKMYKKYLGDRRCYKFIFDQVRSKEKSTSNYNTRALINGGSLCIPERKLTSGKTLKVSFVEQSFGCEVNVCQVRAGRGPFPPIGICNDDEADKQKKQTKSGQCGNRTRTLISLKTETSVSVLQYDLPNPTLQPSPSTVCFDGKPEKNKGACNPPTKFEDCPVPCIQRLKNEHLTHDPTSDVNTFWWVGLGHRIRRISVEDALTSSQQQCQSCDEDATKKTIDNTAECVLFPAKTFTTSKGTTIHELSIFASRTIDESKLKKGESVESVGSSMTKNSFTQQLWMVIATKSPDTTIEQDGFYVMELLQFGGMTVATEASVTMCRPMGNVGLITTHAPPIPMTSTPVAIKDTSVVVKSEKDIAVRHMTYAYQNLPKELEDMLARENCTCALDDFQCHVQNAVNQGKKAGEGGGGGGASEVSKIGNIDKLQHIEMNTHIVQASTSDRRLIVMYFHEIYNGCSAELKQNSAEEDPRSSYVLNNQANQNSLVAEIVNEVPLAGPAQSVDFSKNGQFSLIAMTRLKSEMDSFTRAALMCEMLKKDPNNPFLIPFIQACSARGDLQPRRPSILDFVQIASFCPPGSWCPSFTTYDLSPMEDGYYSKYGYDKVACEPGYFCPQGTKQKCPIGSTCPNIGMKTPFPCRIDPTKSTSCFASGLIIPNICEEGKVCWTPYLPGLPAPPGMKTTPLDVIPRTLIACKTGEYCSLGRRSDDNTLCPSGVFCPSPDIPVPKFCTTPDVNCLKKYCPGNLTCPNTCTGMYSCPEGSTNESLCVAGDYCPDPRSAGNPCPNTSYCPAGTFSTPPPCPAGHYCPSPSKIIFCPNRHFCPSGSFSPQSCGVLDFCPPGSKSKVAGAFGLIFVFALPFVAWAVSSFAYKERDRKRNERVLAKEMRRLSESMTTPPSGPSVSSLSSDLEMPSSSSFTRSFSSSFLPVDTSSSSMEGEGDMTLSSSLLSVHDEEYNDGETETNDDVFAPRRYRVDFEFENLGLKIKGTNKSVLDGVTGKIKSAHVTAVMGPSGAGKSTFVTTLAGKAYYGNPTGTIKINGVVRPLNDFKKVVGFVPQEDIMMRDLTVKENIWFSAQTRLPMNWTTKRKKKYRDATIQVLGLHEIRHAMIGDENTRGISGGQRKRVNIGLEMVADPLVLFLDEPTSGLDSTSSMEVCDALRKIADIGLTIVTVLHQPRYEIFCQFHDVLLLGKGGRAVYLGPSEEALDYFESNGLICPPRVNPPDYMMDVIAGNVSDDFRQQNLTWHQDDLFQMWIDHQAEQKSNNNQQVIEEKEEKESTNESFSTAQLYNTTGGSSALPPHDPSLEVSVTERRQAGGCGLIWRFVKRSLTQQTRHGLDAVIDNGLLFFAALFMSYININIPWLSLPPALPPQCYIDPSTNYTDLNACGEYSQGGRLAIFGAQNFILVRGQMTCMAVGLCTCASAIKVFGRERIVYFREAAGLEQPSHSIAYFIGKDLSVMPQMLLGPLLYCSIFVAMSAALGTFWGLYMVLLGTTFVSYSIGYVVSIVAPTSLAQLVGVVVVFCMSAFDGASPTIPNLRKSPAPLNWGFEHLSYLTPALKAFYDNESKPWINIAKSANIDMIQFAEDSFGYYAGEYGICVCILFGWGIFFRLIGLLILTCKDGNKKL